MHGSDQDRQRLHAAVADMADIDVAEAAAMSDDEILDLITRHSLRTFALTVACRHEAAEGVTLMDEGPREQAERGVAALEKLHDRVHLFPAYDLTVNLFGFGSAPLFGHAMRTVFGDKLKEVPTYRADGTPTGTTAYDDLFTTEGLSEKEAARRAMRGPGLDDS